MVVLDVSIVLAWYMADESHPRAEAVQAMLQDRGGVVPTLFWYELRNALIASERRGRLQPADTTTILCEIHDLGLDVDAEPSSEMTLHLARAYALSVYDAAYLELAQRRGLHLATLDKNLHQAAAALGLV
ncbi:MAG: type II toxin-antitoxin system VapC family toxin [Phycisphaeraceae bacterium]